ncbi:hypothetical protein F5B22DRAFT_357223 [Xylaria bambusicola]|uniref:uncharacterized protein n=1 Tax=Xylaria bambusicola TaxID=326684 RepID=UPI002008D8DB|nr:uncharacterized protein F5B22DRAFT_357223 [Xylaria bambusicola]KAI0525716.1 hypothetical protein F5B22DRAFT_357223 [Xylaria bambusicola]
MLVMACAHFFCVALPFPRYQCNLHGQAYIVFVARADRVLCFADARHQNADGTQSMAGLTHYYVWNVLGVTLMLTLCILGPQLQSQCSAPKECLEITASFPLSFNPTRYLPVRFVMDHSLLCSGNQETTSACPQ